METLCMLHVVIISQEYGIRSDGKYYVFPVARPTLQNEAYSKDILFLVISTKMWHFNNFLQHRNI